MAKKYSKIKSWLLMSGKNELNSSQRNWLRSRDSCDRSVSCIKNAYYRRIDQLNAY
jgi:uncharacterized protein